MQEKTEQIDAALKTQLLESISLKPLVKYIIQVIIRLYRRIRYKKWYDIENRCFFWINGQYAFGLLCNQTPSDIRVLKKYYNRVLFFSRINLFHFDRPDTIIHAYVILILYHKYQQKRYKSLVDAAKNYIKKEASQNDGLIRYRNPSRLFFVDTLGMINGFCYEYSRVFDDEEIKHVADAQLEYVIRKCRETETIIPFHTYDMDTGKPGGSNTWGRGAGWYLIGLMEGAVSSLPEFRAIYFKTIEYVFDHQDDEGFFYDDFEKKHHIDTSITSMAAYALEKGLMHGLIPDQEVRELEEKLKLSVGALIKSTNELGHVVNSSGECRGAGKYSLEYGNFFAQGYTIALFNLLMRRRHESDGQIS